MIQSKEELKEYIEYESHGFSNKFPDSIIGEPQNFQKLLRNLKRKTQISRLNRCL